MASDMLISKALGPESSLESSEYIYMDATAQKDENIMVASQTSPETSSKSLPSSPCAAWTNVEAICEGTQRKSSSCDSLCEFTDKTGWLSDSWKFETIKDASIFKVYNSGDKEKNYCLSQNEKADVKAKEKYKSRLPVYGKRIGTVKIKVKQHKEILPDKNIEKLIGYNEKQKWENIKKKDNRSSEIKQEQKKVLRDYSNISKPVKYLNVKQTEYKEVTKSNINVKDPNNLHSVNNRCTVSLTKPSGPATILSAASANVTSNITHPVTLDSYSEGSMINVDSLSQEGKYSSVTIRNASVEEKGFQQNRENSKIPKCSTKEHIKSSLIKSGISVVPSRIPKGSVPPSVTIKNTLRLSKTFVGSSKLPMCSRILPPGGFIKTTCGPDLEGTEFPELSLQQSSKTQVSTSIPHNSRGNPRGIPRLGGLPRPNLVLRATQIFGDTPKPDTSSIVLTNKKVETNCKENKEQCLGEEENKVEEFATENDKDISSTDTNHKQYEDPPNNSSDSTFKFPQSSFDSKASISNITVQNNEEDMCRDKIRSLSPSTKPSNQIRDSTITETNSEIEIRSPPVLPKINIENDGINKDSENRCDSYIDIEKILKDIQDDIQLIGISRQASVNESESQSKNEDSKRDASSIHNRGHVDSINNVCSNTEESKNSPSFDTKDLMKHLENVLEADKPSEANSNSDSYRQLDIDEDNSVCNSNGDETLKSETEFLSSGETLKDSGDRFDTLISETEFLSSGETLKGNGDRFESDEYNDNVVFESSELRKIVRKDLYPNENYETENDIKNLSSDDKDLFDVNFDIKPMATLKRPLAYGYSHRLPRTSRLSVFFNKRLSPTSKVSDYDYSERDVRRETNKKDNELSTVKECKVSKQTYWDLWLAKKGLVNEQLHVEKDYKTDQANRYVCPMENFSYDPEVLLAQVRYPVSLADSTFSQYSAHVKSHIYDYFGSMKDIPAKSSMEPNYYQRKQEWTISDPELTSENQIKAHQEPCFSSKIPEHTVSDPELTPEHQNIPHSQTNLPFFSEPDLLFGYGSLPRRKPGTAAAPITSSQQIPNKTDRIFSEESIKRYSFLDKRFSDYQNPVYMSTTEIDKMFGVSHSASTCNFMALGPNPTNPWQHLLPLITPPQTPYLGSRSSLVSHERYETPSFEKPSPHSHSYKSSTIHQDSCNPQRKEIATEAHDKKEKRTTLLKNFLRPKDNNKSQSKNLNFFKQEENVTAKIKSKSNDLDTKNKKTPHLITGKNNPLPSVSTISSSETILSSKSSSSASSGDSMATVVPSQKNQGHKWFMKHFGRKNN